MAPPINPAAMPAPTPSPAFAGGATATDETAIVAIAKKATKVFFISLALLKMAPPEGAGLEGTLYAEFSNSLWRKQSAGTVNAW
jgi:hypothetical protein